jgi:hypothetical protein
MQGVAVVAQGDPTVCGDVDDVHGLVDVDDKLTLGVHLDEHLFLIHHFHDLPDVGAVLGLQTRTT